MSVAGIGSNVMFVSGNSPTSNQTSTRKSEDAAARELITDLQKGDMSDAENAYNTLASFGANNSGPWAQGSQMQQSFQQLGQDLASGNLAGARTDAKGLAANQLQNDMQAVNQAGSGNSSALSQAIQNYQSDYWAIFGQTPQSNPLTAGGGAAASGINVTA
jgi:hypothetical protein